MHPLKKNRGVEQLVARQAHNLEVARSNPASATFEGKKLIMWLITFFSFGESGRESDETLLNHIGCAANNVKKCFLQQKKSSNLKR